MRGDDQNQSAMFSYISPEERVPQDHPLRVIRRMTDEALSRLSPQLEKLYARLGRPSIAPEKLLRALLLQVFYSLPSERRLMEQLDYNLLFRWFVGLNMDEAIWDATVFTKNRQRLLEGEIAQAFLVIVVNQAKKDGLVSSDHFTVDGTLLEAWAGMKSYQARKDPPDQGSGTRGRVLRRDRYECKSDREAHLYRKSDHDPHKLSYLGHVLMENRTGLPVQARVTLAHPQGEWTAAAEMAEAVNGGKRRITLTGTVRCWRSSWACRKANSPSAKTKLRTLRPKFSVKARLNATRTATKNPLALIAPCPPRCSSAAPQWGVLTRTTSLVCQSCRRGSRLEYRPESALQRWMLPPEYLRLVLA